MSVSVPADLSRKDIYQTDGVEERTAAVWLGPQHMAS